MLGMHGTYEANLAMHGCDVMLNIGARFDDRVTGRAERLLAEVARRSTSISTPRSINKNVRVDVPIVGDAGTALEALIGCWKAEPSAAGPARRWPSWWRQIDEWRGKDCLRYRQDMRQHHQAAIRARAAVRD